MENLVASVRAVREHVKNDTALEGVMMGSDTTVAAFSDTVILAKTAASPAEGLSGVIERLAGLASSLVTDAAFAVAPLAYRGCISAGLLAIVDEIFVGDAIDEAAELSEQATAAVVWLTPSAVAALTERRSRMVFVEWDVPLHGRGSLRTLVVNPFFATVLLAQDDAAISKRMDEVESALLEPFAASLSVDVAIKRRSTAAFLQAAREFSLKVLPDARRDGEALLASMEGGLLV